MQEELSFGTWLRKQRRALDLSRQALANQVGCAEVTLRRIEAGTLKPSKELANLLLEKLGILETNRSQWISFARGSSGFPSQSFPSSNKSNLPAPLTTFIGRENEQSEVIRLITKHRLVTLTGSGGVGKTRLSIKVGEQVLNNYSDGVWLVELSPILDPLLVPRTVAITIGLRDEPQGPVIDMLSDYLREKQMLLILDNCEHLVDACAQLADTLLKKCPGLEILVTSRETLGILGESLYPVNPLELPDIEQLLEKLRDYESIRLFEERARLVRIDFSLTKENAPSVARICRQLDGIPLALELAAARVGTFSTDQIEERLQESFRLLTTGNRAALPRHRTLLAAFEWSYDLLSEQERLLFRRLAVFMGGWTLQAMTTVCSGNGIEMDEVLNIISQLIHKSLILVETVGSKPRYRKLETIHQYMQGKLMKSEESATIFHAHAEYFLDFAKDAESQLLGPEQVNWVNRLELEESNLRIALDWLIKNGEGEQAMHLGSALGRFWHIRGRFREGRQWLERALEVDVDADQKLQAKVLCWIGILAYTQGDYEVAEISLNRSLAISHKFEDKRIMADAMYFLGVIDRIQNDYSKAQKLFEESLILCDTLKDRHGVGNALINLGIIYQAQGENLRALELFEQSLMIFRELEYKRGVAYATLKLGSFTHDQEHLERRWELLRESLSLSYELGDKWSVAYALSGLATVLCRDGQYEQSGQIQGVVCRLLDELVTQLEPFEEAEYNTTTSTIKAALGEMRYFQILDRAKTLSLEQAIELVAWND